MLQTIDWLFKIHAEFTIQMYVFSDVSTTGHSDEHNVTA